MRSAISFLSLLILISVSLHSQSNDLSLLSSGGGMHQGNNVFLSYSFGEPFTSYVQNQERWITEGFQQPENIDLTTATHETGAEIRFDISPNPAQTLIQVKGDFQNCQSLSIIDITGKKLWNKSITTLDDLAIPLDPFTPGIYWVSIHCGNEIMTQSFIKL